jgi:hypothetical protein
MKTETACLSISRRQFLTTTAVAGASCGLSRSISAQVRPAKPGIVRDRLWVFACPINNDYPNIRRRSLMSPAESAFFLGVPNILMVQVKPGPGQEAWFKPFESPFEQYAVALRPLKRVVWSVVGGGGVTEEKERQEVLTMAKQIPNFAGVYMDDFFHGKGEGKLASLSLEELQGLHREVRISSKKLDLFVTLYTHQLDLPICDYLNLIDVIALWTWKPEELVNLESNLSTLEKLAPNSRKMLGCYVVDYTERKSVPVSAMQYQCELGLRWLREGRIEGIVILGNSVMDLGYEAVDWTRDWIEKVGDLKL